MARRFYTAFGVDEMLKVLSNSSDEEKSAFREYVMKREKGGMDEEAFEYIIKNAYLLSEVLDKFDSTVGDKFIAYFEQTFMKNFVS